MNEKVRCQTNEKQVYFHEEKYIFNRVTIFSNYSPNNQPGDNIKLPTIHYGDARTPNVSQEPQPGPYWSVLAEISESKDRPVLSENILGETLRGLIDAKILDNQAEVVSKFYQLLPFGYPTPTLERDDVLAPTFRYLEARNLYSRGRFGGWKYEVGNQDHSFMQGVEIVDRIVKGTEETTFENPDMANSGIFKK